MELSHRTAGLAPNRQRPPGAFIGLAAGLHPGVDDSPTLFLVLIVNPPESPRRGEYLWLILGLDAFVALAYGLNCAGHYSLAAGLTVACAILGPWAP